MPICIDMIWWNSAKDCNNNIICYNTTNIHSPPSVRPQQNIRAILLFALLLLPVGSMQAWDPVPTPAHTATIDATIAERRIALRLQRRIFNRFEKKLSIEHSIALVQARKKLLRTVADVRFMDRERGSALMHAQWLASAGEHPSWIQFSMDGHTATFSVDEAAIRYSIELGEPVHFPRPKNAILRNVATDRRILRGESHGETQAGYVFDIPALAARIAKALRGQAGTIIDIETAHQEPQLFVIDPDGGSVALTRLSVGKSDFARSPWGRVQNIRKALLERMHGAVIPAGSTFSFNDALVGASGWKNALVIVNGKDLVYEPGGGICQASTTVYRSMLLAGLPVTQRKSHSLYVTYYKDFGVGIDATVYFGKQDLKVVNDTPGDLVMLSRVEGTQAIVELFGIPDRRSIAMEGPFFSQTVPEDLLINGRALRANEIVWTHAVTYPDGREKHSVILSQYKTLPKSLALEYPASRGIAELNGTYVDAEEQPQALVMRGN